MQVNCNVNGGEKFRSNLGEQNEQASIAHVFKRTNSDQRKNPSPASKQWRAHTSRRSNSIDKRPL